MPKTKHGFRKVAIPHFLTLRIKTMKTERLRYRLSVGDYWQGGEWLFVQENGKLMSYSTPYQAFHDSILRYNESHKEPLPMIPLHGLRHTSATLLIANNQGIRSVSARLKIKSFRLGTILVSKRRISRFYNVQKVMKIPGFTRKPGIFLELVT